MEFAESQTLTWLFEEASKGTKLGRNDLVNLLKLIQPPANLHGLFLVLDNLLPVLETAKAVYEIDSEYLPEIDFEGAIQTCNVLLQAQQTIITNPALGNLFPDHTGSVWFQLRGFIENHPLYACLCYRARGTRAVETYVHLQAQVLLAAQDVLISGKSLSKFTDHFLSVRKLSESNQANQLVTLPAKPASVIDYLKIASQARPGTHIRNIGIILQRAYLDAKRKTGTRKKPPVDRDKPGRYAIDDIEDYQNPAELWTGESFVPRGVLTDEESQLYCDLGGSSAEFTGGQDDIPVPIADDRVISGPTLVELAYQGKQRSNQEALRNQFNPLGWNELNQYDLHILLQYLHAEPVAVPLASEEQLLRDGLALMFWMSAPLERIMGLPKKIGMPGSGAQEGLYLVRGDILVARLYSPGPPLESRNIRRSALAYPVECHSNIPLPICAHTTSLINACRSAQPKSALGYDDTVAGESLLDKITRQTRAVLGQLNGRHGTRLSIGRISNHWLHVLGTEQGEDMPSAMLFFGRQERFSVARLHYSCAPVQRMEAAYRKVCTDLFDSLGIASGFPKADPVNGNNYLGTPFCPRPEAVRDLVKSLRLAMEQSRPARKRLPIVKNFHNHYALFTACLIAFATTYRAVKDPSLDERDIHFASGLGIISDKDDATNYHSRFVWIAEVCRLQIINYRRHLQRLFEVFGLNNPALFNLFKQHDQPGRPLSLFMFPYGNDQIMELRPAIIEQELRKNHAYDLPPNAHRHYIKTELLESGCPVEVIEATLGHWEQGQEAWNRFSNLHPLEFCRQLDRHLSPILKRDGWCAVKGFDL